MKIQVLALSAIVTALAFSSFAAEPLLSPRAAGNQIKISSDADTVATTVDYVAAPSALLSPRAACNQLKAVKGVASETTPALACLATMNGTPKVVTECSSHANMPGCTTK